jgi:hypothetical protein
MGSWRPGIGDPTFMGWFTVGAYFTSFLVAVCAAWLNRTKREDGQAFLFWSLVGVLMLFLGINKQLDLQSLFTEMGRQVAKAQGWFDHRRTVQFWFIAIFGTLSAATFLLLTIKMKDQFRKFTLAFVGLFFLLSFVIIRASSFYHFDVVIMYRIFGLKMNWILELTGVFMVQLDGLKDIFLITVRDG